MNKVGKINFKKIQRISPSQFYSMKSCPYKSLLSEALRGKSLLPLSANAYYGTVLHKMLEMISRGVVRTVEGFNEAFMEQVKSMEDKLILDGFTHLVPLQKRVRDYTEKKILLKDHLNNALELQEQATSKKFIPEKWFESKDRAVGGRVDLVIESNNAFEILDFKTGSIIENTYDDTGELSQDIKAGYKEQLKLYAYLYFENEGKFPTKLSLVNLTKEKFNIDFTESECTLLFEEAKQILKSTNESVDSGSFKANPSESNCKFCLYRPACSFYLDHLKSANAFNDVCGEIIDTVQYENGNVTVFVVSGSKKISIAGFSSDKFSYFSENRNMLIRCFNLRKYGANDCYLVTKTTMIYEQSDAV